MCGIVGYIGNKEAYEILINGLKRLEYRGYDSSGVAIIGNEGNVKIFKSKGKVAELEATVIDKDVSGTIGIAHTRWATHGVPNDVNAHPHYSSSGNIAMIHNGIIENYSILKSMLENHGYKFKSSTDTEVLVQLIEYIQLEESVDLVTAVQMALTRVVGAYAIAVIEKDNFNRIIAARKSSPLVIGIGDDEFFLASDATPIVQYTKNVVYLEDEEIAIITRGEKLKIVGLNNIEVKHDITKIDISLTQLEKGGYPHFMLKEIFEQPSTIVNCTRGRIDIENEDVVLSGVINNRDRFLNARRIIIIACGTSWHAALIGEHLIENHCKIPVEVEYASEFRYRNPVINKDDIVIAVSQSGETADTLAAIELAKSRGAFIFGICNAVGSSIARATNSGAYIHVGPEIGVASTKAFTGQVTVLTMLALTLAKEKGTISKKELNETVRELSIIPSKMKMLLELNEQIKGLSQIFTYATNFIYLGRGYSYPVALEGALKLKEISYIHAEGYPAAEMKHGPIALIDAEMPVVIVATRNLLYDKIVSNIQEIKARGGRVIAIVSEGDEIIRSMSDYCIEVPRTIECLDPLLTSIPLQMLAYHIAISKGRDVDQPRNLAKSVTVE